MYTGTQLRENLVHVGTLHHNGRKLGYKLGDCAVLTRVLALFSRNHKRTYLYPLHMIPNTDPIYSILGYTTVEITLSQCLHDVPKRFYDPFPSTSMIST